MHVVSLLGPPGSGKSTVAMAMADEHRRELQVFRLREFAHQQARTDCTVAEALHASRDSLGWLPDSVATSLVQRALGTYAAHCLLLESYPGSPEQGKALVRDLARTGYQGGVIELDVSDAIAWQRLGGRLVCPTCDPRRRRPAKSRPGPMATCICCGTDLERRPTDASPVAARRMARYRQRAHETRAAMRAGGLAWHRIDASQNEPLVIAAALAALHTLRTR